MKKRMICIAVFLLLCFSGCSLNESGPHIVLTNGFEKDEIFRINTAAYNCTLPEMMVLLVNTQNQYENAFGEEIWETSLDGVTLEENVKENVLAQMTQIVSMNCLAGRQKVVLEEEDMARVKEAAQVYYASLNETEIEVMQVTPEIIEQLYAKYLLADMVYQYIIKDINPEISDDEARTITVQHIFFRTVTQDGTGKEIAYSEEAKAEALQRAKKVLTLAKEEGSDFEALILEYSEDEMGTISFGKGEMDIAFEEAAFNLANDEISEIVETEYGYHIIKCINTFNREETDANKVKIVEKKKEEVFSQEYEAFVDSCTKMFNEELWAEVALVDNEEVTTSSFFEVYEQYFGENALK